MRAKLLRIIGFVFLVIGVIGIIYAFGAKAYNVSFWSFLFLLSLVSIFIGILEVFVIPGVKHKYARILVKSFHTFIILIFISFLIIESILVYTSSKKDTANPDYIVILGAGLNGSVPSQVLSYRLNSSLDLIKVIGEDVKIIVTGGQGPGEDITEAEAMKSFLVNRGVSTDRIIIEDRATSTKENIEFTKDIINKLEGNKDVKITLVTSNFHMFRSKNLAKRAGFATVYCWSSPTHPYITPIYYFREYMAVIKSMIFDWPSLK